MNKLKGIVLVVFVSLASIMMPFNIYADTLTQANIIGTNFILVDSNHMRDQTYSTTGGSVTVGINIFTYDVQIELDNYYLGYINVNIPVSYYDQTPDLTVRTLAYNRRVFVNGKTAHVSLTFWTGFSQDPIQRNSQQGTPNVTLSDSNVTLLNDIDSIEQIINILSDLYNSNDQIEGLLSDQLAQLQQVVSNTSLANQYLDSISKLRQYNFPLESFSPIMYNSQKEIIDLFTNGYWKYPVYKAYAGDTIFRIYSNNGILLTFILGINKNINGGNFAPNIELENGERFEITEMYYGTSFNIYKFVVRTVSSGWGFVSVKLKTDANIIPIYMNTYDNKNISTDFALQYGLSNQLLDDVHKIANGTIASNNASQQLDSDTSNFETDRDDLVNIEDNMGDNMDSAMNQITPSNNGLSGFGGNFLTSAVWVRTQFERLTNNTPYGSLIVYGMTLGLALLLLGKVML